MSARRWMVLGGLGLGSCGGPSVEPSVSTEVVSVADPFELVSLSPSSGSLVDQLASASATAGRKGLSPYVQVYGDWCLPCRQLRDAMGHPSMQEAFSGTYVILLDVDVWRPQFEQAGLVHSDIPRFHGLDSDGMPDGRLISGSAWAENIPANMAPPLASFFAGKPSPGP